MKKGPRCPVCGSVNIKEFAEGVPSDKKSGEEKEGGASGANTTQGCEPQWKCGDCYRKFVTPHEQSK